MCILTSYIFISPRNMIHQRYYMERFSLTASVGHIARTINVSPPNISKRLSAEKVSVVGDTKREITIERIDWPSIGYIVRGGFAISRNSIKPLAQLTTRPQKEEGIVIKASTLEVSHLHDRSSGKKGTQRGSSCFFYPSKHDEKARTPWILFLVLTFLARPLIPRNMIAVSFVIFSFFFVGL